MGDAPPQKFAEDLDESSHPDAAGEEHAGARRILPETRISVERRENHWGRPGKSGGEWFAG